jgi:hypothetical protein
MTRRHSDSDPNSHVDLGSSDRARVQGGSESRERPDEIWGCPDRLRSAGRESATHLWPKIELQRRREDRAEPSFPGEYRFERKVADRAPDCVILGDGLNRWIEFVVDADQEYRAKTREALRLGFIIHWVFDVDAVEQRQAARAALAPELAGPFSFGRFDPWNEVLELGDPVTFKNFAFPVEDIAEFQPREILGYRKGAARITHRDGGFDVGMFEVSGVQRRVLADKTGQWFRMVAPGQDAVDAPWGFPTRDGLERLVERGVVRRLGPVRR